jgi:hypothetical protein
VDRSQGLTAHELLSYTPGAAAELKVIEQAFSSCHTLQIDGATIAVSTSTDKAITGSDETFVLRAHGLISGHAIGIDIELARFGDCIVGSYYGGLGDPASVDDVADALLVKAAAKARAKKVF